jgi:hypothetical protein
MKFVCITAIARSGSNYVTQLLRSCADLTAYGEIFRKRGKPGEFADALRDAAGDAVEGDDEIAEWRRKNPGAALDAIKASTGADPIAFKIFHMNIRRDALHDQVFSRDDTAYILMYRRPIECFISLVKAQEFSVRFRKSDTTSLKPSLDVDRFINWATKTRDWYTFLETEIPGKRPWTMLSYERHLVDRPPAEALETLRDMIEGLGFARPKLGAAMRSLERNDREARYQDRVENWAVFETEIRRNPQHAALLDWAEAVPAGPAPGGRASTLAA